MQLKDTVGKMLSDDHSYQLQAEIEQAYIRMTELESLLYSIKNDLCSMYTPIVPTEVLEMQHKTIQAYLTVLLYRAEIEKIEINLDA